MKLVFRRSGMKHFQAAASIPEPLAVIPLRPIARTCNEIGKAKLMQDRVQTAGGGELLRVDEINRRAETDWVTCGKEGCLGIAFAREEWRCSGGLAVSRLCKEDPIHNAIETGLRRISEI
jgi:hypothetical protein